MCIFIRANLHLLNVYLFKKGPVCLTFKPCELNPCGEYDLCLELGELGKYECMCPTYHSKFPYCQNNLKNRSLINLILISFLIGLIVIVFVYGVLKNEK